MALPGAERRLPAWDVAVCIKWDYTESILGPQIAENSHVGVQDPRSPVRNHKSTAPLAT